MDLFIRVDQTFKVDRRELETVWRASNGSRRSTATTSHIAHLALHPNFTQMRNQGKGVFRYYSSAYANEIKNSSLLYSISLKLSENPSAFCLLVHMYTVYSIPYTVYWYRILYTSPTCSHTVCNGSNNRLSWKLSFVLLFYRVALTKVDKKLLDSASKNFSIY